MRNLLTCLCLVALPVWLNAQIIIYGSDVPIQPGTCDTYETTDDGVAVDLGSPGAGQNWNYSAMVTEYSDTGLWVDPAETPLIADFPDANCCRFVEDEEGTYNYYYYYNMTDSGFWMLGAGIWYIEGEIGFAMHYESSGPMIVLPVEYGNSWSCTLTGYDLEGEISGVTVADFVVDAWGTITDYLGTYSCLRLQQYSESTDYDGGEPGEVTSDWSYLWMVPDYGNICEIDSNENEPDENFTEGKFRRLISITEAVPGSLPMIMPTSINLGTPWPNPFNPATQIPLELACPTQLRLEAYDLNGRLVTTIAEGSYPAGDQLFTFNGGGLASGVYLIRATVPGQQPVSRKVLLLK